MEKIPIQARKAIEVVTKSIQCKNPVIENRLMPLLIYIMHDVYLEQIMLEKNNYFGSRLMIYR